MSWKNVSFSMRNNAVNKHASTVATHNWYRIAVVEIFARYNFIFRVIRKEIRPFLELVIVDASSITSK